MCSDDNDTKCSKLLRASLRGTSGIVLIALSRCNRVFTRRLRLCHSHTVYRREVREGDREGPNRLESEV